MSTTKNQANSPQSGLSAEQKRALKKYAVFALMGIICAGCIYLIFATPSGKAKQAGAGFNTEIPLPKEATLIGDKRDAYEREHIKQQQSERMRSLEDFSSLFGEKAIETDDDLSLITDRPAPQTGGGGQNPRRPQSSIQSSAQTYREMNRMLGSFYEQPREDPQKEALQQELDELKARLNESENSKNSVDKQLEIMEKSFQMASKYMPGLSPENAIEHATDTGAAPGKTAVASVTQVREQTVSSLHAQMSGAEFVETYSQPRNMGFLTATSQTEIVKRNTILACIHANQTVMNGQSVRLRLLEPVHVGGMYISRNILLSGIAKFQGERLEITVNSLENNGAILPILLKVYDLDGQAGIFIPNLQELNAAKEIAANMGTSVGTSINLSSDAGEQFITDMGRNLIQGISQFAAKKLREVKVHLKAGYRVFLLPDESLNDNQLQLSMH
jgi:conjugative transposon TraM protein